MDYGHLKSQDFHSWNHINRGLSACSPHAEIQMSLRSRMLAGLIPLFRRLAAPRAKAINSE